MQQKKEKKETEEWNWLNSKITKHRTPCNTECCDCNENPQINI